MYGYRGKILKVNLGSKVISEMPLDSEAARKFIGGIGLAASLLIDMVDSETDPLGPSNPLLILNGPFCGTMVPTGSKTAMCSKSPQTGLWGHSIVGGHFGADLKFAGYDGVLVEGASEKPCYLLIDDSRVEIRDAHHLWGKNTEETWNALKEETGFRNAGIARIGIAGENLVKYACVCIDHYRAAGRTGMGAVMGSKKLKAMVVHGTDRKIPVADAEGLNELGKSLNESLSEDPTFNMYSELGNAGYVDMASMMYGSLPAGYYTVSDFDSYNLSGTTMRETILVGKSACYRCPIGCGRVIEINEGKYATGRFAGPEYEVIGSMGTLILTNDLEAVTFTAKQMELMGIDFISGGSTIALAYYLYKEGKVTAEDLDGITPEWGESDSALALIEKIAKREGVGNLMAEGSLAFARKFGCEELAAQVNGLELPMHDPRGFSGMAIAYATSPRGACHMTADMYNVQMGQTNEALGIESQDRFANEAEITAKQQDLRCITNSLLICHYYAALAEELVEFIQKVTGWNDYSLQELAETGERLFTLLRLFNLKMGYQTNNERLPEIVLRPLEGPTEGYVPDVDTMLETWYHFRGWNRKTGAPPKERIEKLGLSGFRL
ncbi:MAG: aldehyde ferredoxin oxidoreductase [Candidatus Thorarchaeota archaeon]|nr:aldehyde ferredoxin oxidoreductase [Candidatus Thorarchaeota archaeon]